MAFTNAKEFKRQLDFQRTRIMSKLREAVAFFERKEIRGKLDTPVAIPGTGYDENDPETVEALTEEGFEVYHQGTHVRTVSLETVEDDCTNEFLIELLQAVETTQWNIVKEELDY